MKTEPTTFYQYANDEKEYVFCVKGRPFACLTSPHLPTPTASLIDYELVRSLGLKMTDLQCRKFSYAGFKMRTLGKISTAVQCVIDGVSQGTYHVKANVILDLAKNLDSECVAGAKMAAQLESKDGNCTYSGAFTPPRTSPTKSSTNSSPPASISSNCSTPTRILLQKIEDGAKSPVESPSDLRRSEAARALMAARAKQSPSRSPPGFPTTPQYCPSPAAAVSPLTANIRQLDDMFNGADVQPHDHAELRALRDQDHNGQVTYNNGLTNFYSTDGFVYELGHGRKKCTMQRCYDEANAFVPHNCAFSGHWTFPSSFRSCGPNCQGAFCPCIRLYR